MKNIKKIIYLFLLAVAGSTLSCSGMNQLQKTNTYMQTSPNGYYKTSTKKNYDSSQKTYSITIYAATNEPIFEDSVPALSGYVFSPDSNIFIYWGAKTQIMHTCDIVNLNTRQQRTVIQKTINTKYSFSKDNNFLLLQDLDNTIRIIELKNFQTIFKLKNANHFSNWCISPSGTHLLLFFAENKVKAFYISCDEKNRKKTPMFTTRLIKMPISCRIHHERYLILSYEKNNIQVFDMEEKKDLYRKSFDSNINKLMISPDGKYLFLSFDNLYIKICDLTKKHSSDELAYLLDRQYNQNIKKGTIKENIAIIQHKDNTITLFDLKNKKDLLFKTFNCPVSTFSISQNKQLTGVALTNGSIIIFNGKEEIFNQSFEKAPTRLILNDNLTILIQFTTFENTIQEIYDIKKKKKICWMLSDNKIVAFNKKNNILLAYFEDKKVAIFDNDTKQTLFSYTLEMPFYYWNITPDKSLLTFYFIDNTAKIIDLTGNQPLEILSTEPLEELIDSVAISHDQQTATFVLVNKKQKSFHLQKKANSAPSPTQEHENEIIRKKVNDTYLIIVTRTHHQSTPIKVIDIKKDKEVFKLAFSAGTITSCDITPDNKFVYFTSEQFGITDLRLFDLQSGTLIFYIENITSKENTVFVDPTQKYFRVDQSSGETTIFKIVTKKRKYLTKKILSQHFDKKITKWEVDERKNNINLYTGKKRNSFAIPTSKAIIEKHKEKNIKSSNLLDDFQEKDTDGDYQSSDQANSDSDADDDTIAIRLIKRKRNHEEDSIAIRLRKRKKRKIKI